jgi:hypothetical protein
MKQITAIQTNDGKIFLNNRDACHHLDRQLTAIIYKVAGELYNGRKICVIAQILRDSLPELQKANDILTDLQTYETE